MALLPMQQADPQMQDQARRRSMAQMANPYGNPTKPISQLPSGGPGSQPPMTTSGGPGSQPPMTTPGSPQPPTTLQGVHWGTTGIPQVSGGMFDLNAVHRALLSGNEVSGQPPTSVEPSVPTTPGGGQPPQTPPPPGASGGTTSPSQVLANPTDYLKSLGFGYESPPQNPGLSGLPAGSQPQQSLNAPVAVLPQYTPQGAPTNMLGVPWSAAEMVGGAPNPNVDYGYGFGVWGPNQTGNGSYVSAAGAALPAGTQGLQLSGNQGAQQINGQYQAYG